jgi:hypothetical protein
VLFHDVAKIRVVASGTSMVPVKSATPFLWVATPAQEDGGPSEATSSWI